MKNNTARKHAPQGRPPASKGEDRREHILDNALTLFATQGIAGTTVAQIAGASGVTPAMVHYYFHNREGLLDAVVRTVWLRLWPMYGAGLRTTSLRNRA